MFNPYRTKLCHEREFFIPFFREGSEKSGFRNILAIPVFIYQNFEMNFEFKSFYHLNIFNLAKKSDAC